MLLWKVFVKRSLCNFFVLLLLVWLIKKLLGYIFEENFSTFDLTIFILNNDKTNKEEKYNEQIKTELKENQNDDWPFSERGGNRKWVFVAREESEKGMKWIFKEACRFLIGKASLKELCLHGFLSYCYYILHQTKSFHSTEQNRNNFAIETKKMLFFLCVSILITISMNTFIIMKLVIWRSRHINK